MDLTDGDFRTAIEELISLYETLPATEVDVENARLMQVAHGWTAQIFRFAKSILVLADSGFGHEADVIARSMLEYTVILHWVLEVGDDAVDALMSEHQRSLKAASKKADPDLGLPMEAIQEILSVEVREVDEQDTLRWFEGVCRELGVESNLYVVYRVMCAVAHPTISAAAAYLVDLGDSVPSGFKPEPSGGLEAVPLAASLLVWAASSLDSLLEGRPMEESIEGIAARIETVPHLPPRQRRHPTT